MIKIKIKYIFLILFLCFIIVGCSDDNYELSSKIKEIEQHEYTINIGNGTNGNSNFIEDDALKKSILQYLKDIKYTERPGDIEDKTGYMYGITVKIKDSSEEQIYFNDSELIYIDGKEYKIIEGYTPIKTIIEELNIDIK